MRLTALMLLAAVGVTNSCATSSRGDAQVKLVDGTPCFSVVETSTVKLSRLAVNQLSNEKRDWKSPPNTMWLLGTKAAPETIDITSQACLSYGQTPANMVALQEAKPLKPQTTYSVFLSGKPQPNNFNMLGYSATFCLIPTEDGKSIAAATVYDYVAEKWRDARCNATAPK
jgi:hypothetical protein